MKHRLLLMITAWCITACTKDTQFATHEVDFPTGTTVADTINLVARICSQSRLYTAEYQINKIITHQDLLQFNGKLFGKEIMQPLSLGNRKIAIPMQVTLKAYIDFTTFSHRNVQRDSNYIHLILPDPHIIVTSSRIDHEGVKQYTSLFRTRYTDEEMTSLTRQGIETVLQQTTKMDILNTTRKCAAQTLIPLLQSLGYSENQILITFRQDLDREVLFKEKSMIESWQPKDTRNEKE